MLSRILTPFYNINGFGWLVLTSALLVVAIVILWAIAVVEMPVLQFFFIVLFPLMFVVIIPLIAFLLFVHSEDK